MGLSLFSLTAEDPEEEKKKNYWSFFLEPTS
jgi:hypothetical protein